MSLLNKIKVHIVCYARAKRKKKKKGKKSRLTKMVSRSYLSSQETKERFKATLQPVLAKM